MWQDNGMHPPKYSVTGLRYQETLLVEQMIPPSASRLRLSWQKIAAEQRCRFVPTSILPYHSPNKLPGRCRDYLHADLKLHGKKAARLLFCSRKNYFLRLCRILMRSMIIGCFPRMQGEQSKFHATSSLYPLSNRNIPCQRAST